MTNDLKTEKLVDLFQGLSERQFTGKLEVQSSLNSWELYFCLGRMVWAAGGSHPIRRWYRLLGQYCPQVRPKSVRPCEPDQSRSWKYQALSLLVRQQTITSEQAIALIKSNIGEVLFDILQQEEKATLVFKCNLSDDQTVLDNSLLPLNPVQALQEAQQLWDNWREVGLANLSPNLVPLIKHPEQLEQLARPQAYQTLIKLIDGKRSVRDAAIALRQDVLVLTRSLLPYVRKGAIKLVNLPDFPKPTPFSAKQEHSKENKLSTATPSITSGLNTANKIQNPKSSSATQNPKSLKPLVAYVEDSAQERQIMESILAPAKYGFVGIEDSMQALPLLLQHKPDIIFLDLVMPVANGYEICAQIRRVSTLKDTPVIILTGHDGIVDRVRAKIVGATDFLAKPIAEQKVIGVLQKYLSSSSEALDSPRDLRYQTS